MSAPEHDFLQFMQETAREAGELLLSYFGKVAIEYKGDVDLVTEADRKSEKLIIARLKSRWPAHDITAEESARTATGSDYRWYIDPLDGTTNFAHGYPVFCVSIAVDYKGDRIAGVIYDPTRKEMFSAGRGAGSEMNGRKIRVSKTPRLAESLLATGFPSHKRHKNPNIRFYHQLSLRTHGVRRAGSAAIDLAYVACGRYDGFWEFNLNPWDTAAGVLLVEEAGGRVTGFLGERFDISSREVLASNGTIHKELDDQLRPVMEGKDLEDLPSAVEYAREKTRR